MRLAALLLVLFALGCGSTDSVAVQETPEGMEMIADEDFGEVGEQDRFLGNIRDMWSDHVRDCQSGVDFTYRSMARETERNWARMKWLFD